MIIWLIILVPFFVDPFTGNGIPAKTSNSSITPVSNNDVVQKKSNFLDSI
uniref:Uncharacterized protein n=1 Tax=Klebsiella pneumoniae TaxID=573 RepID=A0A8B0SWD8_KLEPN|nr:hypothetical protein [Klebsiella pneumoniae]